MSPARSKKQAVAMNIAAAIQKGKMQAKPGMPGTEMAQNMSSADVGEFAGTPQAGLPQVAPKPPRAKQMRKVRVQSSVTKKAF